MKDILTLLTQSIGEEIAKRTNNNIIDNLLYEGAEDIDFKQFLKDLKKEDIELFKKVQEYTKKSKLIKSNKRTSSSSSSSSSSDYNYSCGSGRSRSSCGSDYHGWGSSCGSSRSSRSYC